MRKTHSRLVRLIKKFLTVFLIVLIGSAFFPTVGLAVLKGDLDNDGVVNISDALLELQIVVGLVQATPYELSAGDMKNNRIIDISDALLILREVVGLGPTVSGTASQGLALPIGTAVTLTDPNGNSATTTVGVNGSYNLQISGLIVPYILNAGEYYSSTSAAGTTDTNPLTTLCMQVVLGTPTITSSTPLPSNFQTQYASVVSNLETSIDGLYPASVTATQRDFLSGTLTIGVGVDAVFGALTIIPPDTAGVFSASVGSQQIFSGITAGGTATITPNPTAISSSSSTIFPPMSPNLVSLAVIPTSATITLGATQQFTATGMYSDGTTKSLTSSVAWSSLNTAVAIVSNTSGSNGMATSLSPGGPISITATDPTTGITGTATLTVTSKVLASINITPVNPSIAVGATQQFTATGTYSDGSTQDLTSSVIWSSSSTPVATVATSGLATAVAAGSTTITATSGSITGTNTLTVTSALFPIGTWNGPDGVSFTVSSLSNGTSYAGSVTFAGGTQIISGTDPKNVISISRNGPISTFVVSVPGFNSGTTQNPVISSITFSGAIGESPGTPTFTANAQVMGGLIIQAVTPNSPYGFAAQATFTGQ